MAKVQVIMPSFNRPNLVQQAIKSVQNQTFKDWRLYIMDNSSESLWGKINEVFMQVAKSDNRIIVDHTIVDDKTRYQFWYCAIVTNKALFTLAQNEPYVQFTTDDNIMMPNKLEVLTKFLDNNTEAQVVSGILEVRDEGGRVVERYGGVKLKTGDQQLDFVQPLWRRTLVSQLGKFNEKMDGKAMDAIYYERTAKLGISVYGVSVLLDVLPNRNRHTRHVEAWRKKGVTGQVME